MIFDDALARLEAVEAVQLAPDVPARSALTVDALEEVLIALDD